MNRQIAYIIAVLFGAFLAFSVFLLHKLIPVSKSKNVKETFDNTAATATTQQQVVKTIEVETVLPPFPHRNDNFMMLTTFNGGESISNNDLRWYDNFLNKTDYSLVDENKNLYFNLNNPINLIDDATIRNAKGASLKNVSMKGPIAYNFANDDKNNSITEFSTIFMMKITRITEHAVLYEMLCNTASRDTDDNVVYIPQSFSINIYKTGDQKANIDIFFGKNKYIIADIHTDILISENIITLSLSYSNSKLTAYLENNTYTFDLQEDPKLSLGSLPININKNGSLDMILYSFAYYKKALTKEDVSDYKKYVNFYLNGIDKIINEKLEVDKKLQRELEKRSNDSNELAKCRNAASTLPKCELHDYETIDIKPPSEL